jgi:hypothetical protein
MTQWEDGAAPATPVEAGLVTGAVSQDPDGPVQPFADEENQGLASCALHGRGAVSVPLHQLKARPAARRNIRTLVLLH